MLNTVIREARRPFLPRTWRKWLGIRQLPGARPRERPLAAVEQCAAAPARAPIPSMLTSEEMEFFARCAQQASGLHGEIVDLGCWMGSTAIALAQGVHRGGGRQRVRAFDLFRWESWMATYAGNVFGLYEDGESFAAEARRITRDHGHGLIDLTTADLEQYRWTGEPVKLLLVDAMKSAPLTQQIARTFFPCLQAGGFLLHQDFKHRYTCWLHLLQFRVREHFRFLESVPGAATVGFEVIKRLLPLDVERACHFASLTEAEADAAFAHSLSLVAASEHLHVAGAHLVYYCHCGKTEKARQVAEHYRQAGLDVVTGCAMAQRALGDQPAGHGRRAA